MLGAPPVCGSFGVSQATAAANTVFTRLIPPFVNQSPSAPKMFVYDPGQGVPNWWTPSDAWAHVTDLVYTSLTTAHSLYILRPLNWTYFTAAVAANTTAVTLAADPGAYATKFKYPLPSSSALPNLANNLIAAGDYCCYQLNDGRWQLDLVASGSGTAPVMTTGTPNVTGAGINAYSPFFWFGAVGDTDPNTGVIQPLLTSVANTKISQQTAGFSLWNSLHRGDPLLFVSSNGTDAGVLNALAGYYSNVF